MAADALSQLSEASSKELLMLTIPNFIFLQELKAELSSHPDFLAYRQQIKDNPQNHSDCVILQGFILQRGRIWLQTRLRFIQTILAEFHSTPIGGHMEVTKTLARVGENFIWPGMKEGIHRFVTTCVDCQQTKYDHRKQLRLLSSLPIPL